MYVLDKEVHKEYRHEQHDGLQGTQLVTLLLWQTETELITYLEVSEEQGKVMACYPADDDEQGHNEGGNLLDNANEHEDAT